MQNLYLKRGAENGFKEAFQISKQFSDSLKCLRFENATVLPYRDDSQHLGGILDCKGSFVGISSLYENRKVGPYEYNPDSEDIVNGTIIYIGMLIDVYGHAITDNLKKLWFLNTPEGKALTDAGAQLAYIANWGNTPPNTLSVFLN